MIAILENGRQFDARSPIDISIPLRFNGAQPNAYGVEPASAKACEYGSLVGDTRRGGSCNFEQYTFIPHCNGTHTECVGHITEKRISVRQCLEDIFLPGLLVTVDPVDAYHTDERYEFAFQAVDKLITAEVLRAKFASTSENRFPLTPAYAGGTDFALIVRTQPNDDSKLARLYDASNVPPYFTADAMQFIVEAGVKHLLVDLPSIDRLFDDGLLANHRKFWNIDPGSREVNAETRSSSTVTELIYVPDMVEDGEYVLNLQIAPFESDCSPSRPLLFRYN